MKYLRVSMIICALFFFRSLETYAQNPLTFSDKPLVLAPKTYSDTISSLSLDIFLIRENISTIESEALRKLYEGRKFQLAWFSKGNLTPVAQAFWTRYKQYLTFVNDSSFIDKKLVSNMESLMSKDLFRKKVADTAVELYLSHQFYTFIQRVYIGRVAPEDVEWNIPRKKITAGDLLQQLSVSSDETFDWLPVSTHYVKMREQLVILRNRRNIVEAPIVVPKIKLIKQGDSSSVTPAIKKALYVRGDLQLLDSAALYTPVVAAAVMNFQSRFGLSVDGVIGPNVVKALNIPISMLEKQLLVNMERMRWMPEQTQKTTVWVNIPEYKLYIFNKGEEVMKMNIVVGTAANRTVIFSDKIQYVVFSPYWNVPESIVRKEVLPAIRRDGGYLGKSNMEITGRRNGLPIIRQKPGADNALGKVKFIFPNQYDIYFHDTPSKHLFGQSTRAFSHGCIRLSEPVEFAKFLLKDNSFWTDSEIELAMNLGKEKWVKLPEPIPVTIGYFTAWVDALGQLNFREDIYGHDKKMAEQLFGNAN